MATASDFAQMTNTEFIDYGDMFNEYEGPTCPHCDGALHANTHRCWCYGCDHCLRIRTFAATYAIGAAVKATTPTLPRVSASPPETAEYEGDHTEHRTRI